MCALACVACTTTPRIVVDICLRRAEEAAQAPDWAGVRAALDDACQVDPRHLDAQLRRAEVLLKAYAEVDAAEECYLGLVPRSRARALHGLALCALWRGDEARALDLMRSSIEERATPDCARDLASRLIAKGDPEAERALGVVERVAGGSLRGDLLLAAAGRRPVPEPLPIGWSYGLERARLLPTAAAAAEVDSFLDSATATPDARAAYARALQGDFRQARNRDTPAGVQSKVPETTHS